MREIFDLIVSSSNASAPPAPATSRGMSEDERDQKVVNFAQIGTAKYGNLPSPVPTLEI
jgi:hypothetical protein